ncbi:MAG: polysaccharide pyruvyl transferase family protein [Nitrospirae bacterium]|nr:polysaccharide pyruvyl transferase family protein [Nitrospirota bacterium]
MQKQQISNAKNKKKVLLIGYYGHKNVGDDALAEVCIENIWELMKPDVEITVMSSSKVYHESSADVSYPDLSRRFSRTRAIICTDVLFYGGGGIFQDYRATGLADLRDKYRHVTVAKLLGKKVLFIGVSVDNLITDTGRLLTKKILNKSDYISVRDSDTYNYLKHNLKVTHDVEQAFDLAVLLAPESANKSAVQSKIIGLSVLPLKRSALMKDEDLMLQSLSDSMRNIIEDYGFDVRLFIFNDSDGDAALAEKLSSMINVSSSVSIVQYQKPKEMLAKVAECSHFVAMRLHSAIYAYMAQVPFVIINYHTKCERFARSVGLDQRAIINSFENNMASEKILNLIGGCVPLSNYDIRQARDAVQKTFNNALSII